MSEPNQAAPRAPRPGWNKAKPEIIPRSTPWPVAMALGITLSGWGLITSPIIGGVGVSMFAISLAGWIGEMRHER